MGVGQLPRGVVVGVMLMAGLVTLAASPAAVRAADDGFTALGAPVRLLDTRAGASTVDGLGAGGGQVGRGSTTVVPVGGRAGIAAGAASVVMNVTIVSPSAAGYASVYPCDAERPNASNLNFAAGQTIPNLVISRVAGDGTVCVFVELYDDTATTHLLADATGSFTDLPAGPSCQGVAPTLLGTSGNDVLTGSDGPDVIVGLAGDDQIIGLGGDDRICGDDGTDLLVPGGGVDFVDGGPGAQDIVVYFDASVPMTVNLATQRTTGNGDDQLFAIEGAAGGVGNDHLIGSDADELFVGYQGDDLIEGKGGFDLLMFIDDEAPDGVYVDLLAGSAYGAGTDTISGIDGVVGTDAADLLIGTAGTQLLVGGGGDDELDGQGDTDVLDGGAGDDSLYGGDGDDYMDGGTGDDLLEGDAGRDVLEFAQSPAIYVDLHPSYGYADDDDDGFIDDSVSEIEAVVGTPGDDVILGTDGPDQMLGGFGNDYLEGRSGDDVLTLYETGTIVGGPGSDRCSGGAVSECESSSAPPASQQPAAAATLAVQVPQYSCAQCILGGTSTIGGTLPLDWWYAYPFGYTWCGGGAIVTNLPGNPERDYGAYGRPIELWVQVNVAVNGSWVFGWWSPRMWWDRSYVNPATARPSNWMPLFNAGLESGFTQTTIGGWRYDNYAPVGSAWSNPINAGYTVAASVVLRYTGNDGVQRVVRAWSEGTACAF